MQLDLLLQYLMMPSNKDSKTKKSSHKIFDNDLGSIIFLSALTLNYMFLGLFMFQKVQQRDVKIQLLAEKNISERIAVGELTFETNVLGEMAVEEKRLPENFPADFPLYYQTELSDVWGQEGENLDAISIVWETKNSPKKVFDYYLTQLKFFGWESEIILESDISYTFSFGKKKVEGFVGITTSDLDKTIISVTLGISR